MNSLLTSNPITAAVAAAEWYLPWSRLSMSFRILAMVPKKLQKRSERLHSLSSAIRQRSGGGQSTNTLCLASIKAKLYIPSSIKTMLIFWHTKWPILTQKSTLFKSQIVSFLPFKSIKLLFSADPTMYRESNFVFVFSIKK